MSEYINNLLDLYNQEKSKNKPRSFIKPVKKLLKFYGVKPE